MNTYFIQNETVHRVIELLIDGRGAKAISQLTGVSKTHVRRLRDERGIPAAGRRAKFQIGGRSALGHTFAEIKADARYWKNYDRLYQRHYALASTPAQKAVRSAQKYYADIEKSRAYGNAAAKKRYQKIKNDTSAIMPSRLRTRIYRVLKGQLKSAPTLRLIGCDIAFLKEYLSVRFQPGMTWDNYGSHWEIDHKRPCASFNLADPAQQRECFHYTNLQPLTKRANRQKHAQWNP